MNYKIYLTFLGAILLCVLCIRQGFSRAQTFDANNQDRLKELFALSQGMAIMANKISGKATVFDEKYKDVKHVDARINESPKRKKIRTAAESYLQSYELPALTSDLIGNNEKTRLYFKERLKIGIQTLDFGPIVDPFVDVCDASFTDDEAECYCAFLSFTHSGKEAPITDKISYCFGQAFKKYDRTDFNEFRMLNAEKIQTGKYKKVLDCVAVLFEEPFMGMIKTVVRENMHLNDREAQDVISMLLTEKFRFLLAYEFDAVFDDNDVTVVYDFFKASVGEKYRKHFVEINTVIHDMTNFFEYELACSFATA